VRAQLVANPQSKVLDRAAPALAVVENVEGVTHCEAGVEVARHDVRRVTHSHVTECSLAHWTHYYQIDTAAHGSVVRSEEAIILHPLAGENKAHQIERISALVAHLLFHVCDGVRLLYIHTNTSPFSIPPLQEDLRHVNNY
jgi:hypothetical protein